MARSRDEGALRPIGLAFTAVVAGLSSGAASAADVAREVVRAPDPPAPTCAEEFVVFTGGDAVEPFAEPDASEVSDPFGL